VEYQIESVTSKILYLQEWAFNSLQCRHIHIYSTIAASVGNFYETQF
jgi:hypothetical protein